MTTKTTDRHARSSRPMLAGLARALLLTAFALPGVATAQDGGAGSDPGGVLSPDEIAQLRAMAETRGSDAEAPRDMTEIYETLGLDADKADEVSDEQHLSRAVALLGYVPEGAEVEKPLRVEGEPLAGEGREVLSGQAIAISGDTIELEGREIRLQGVRSPGGDDICLASSGEAFDCLSWAISAANGILGDRSLTCAVTEELDERGARIGWCEISLGDDDVRDLGSVAVRAGLLLATDKAGGISPYRAEQAMAERQPAGIWSADFKPGCRVTGACT